MIVLSLRLSIHHTNIMWLNASIHDTSLLLNTSIYHTNIMFLNAQVFLSCSRGCWCLTSTVLSLEMIHDQIHCLSTTVSESVCTYFSDVTSCSTMPFSSLSGVLPRVTFSCPESKHYIREGRRQTSLSRICFDGSRIK